LPWDHAQEDWCCSLQLEGGTAVFAGIDLLVQLQRARGQGSRTKVAVAERSYHGPAATSPGAPNSPLFDKGFQVTYPAPTVLRESMEGLEAEFQAFLDIHGGEVAVILFEPQWGSSNASKCWPKETLRHFIELAKSAGILVLCDEIMCGLGRHGHETCFLSTAWELDVDAVTFGKAVASGVFPLSGVAVKEGLQLQQEGKGVLHMHTYAGSSQLALLAATEVLKMMPAAYHLVASSGRLMQDKLQELEKETAGFVRCNGQGLMWGAIFAGSSEDRARAIQVFKKECLAAGVWPYFIPIGGFQLTPLYDISEVDLLEGLERLAGCVHRTRKHLHPSKL